MIDREAGKRAFRAAQNNDFTDSGWVPMPVEELAAELANSHPRYSPTALLGYGGMGAVYSAVDGEISQRVAIKVLRSDALCDDAYLDRFEREVANHRKLHHPNIVRVLDAGKTHEGSRFFVMELLDGHTLAQVLQLGQYIELSRIESVMSALCQGAEYIHGQGLVHRDFKASNVFITNEGRVFILDFGIARDIATGPTTASRLFGTPGTPGHIAPEVRDGSPASPASDIYALGVVFYQMLTGTIPDGWPKDPSRIRGNPALDEIARKALRASPNERYATAALFGEALVLAMKQPNEQPQDSDAPSQEDFENERRINCMKIHPYIFAGLGSKFWTTYRIDHDTSTVEGWFLRPETIPLKNAKIKGKQLIGAQFGLGRIEIISEGGIKQVWENVANVKAVEANLVRVSKGLPLVEQDFNSDTIQPLIQSTPIVQARFVHLSELGRHRAFFSSLGSSYPLLKSLVPAQGEKWKVVAKWDASHAVPKRGDGQRVNYPQRIAWSPTGNAIFTTCDAWSMKSWTPTGGLIGSEGTDYGYGEAHRFFVSTDGGYVFQESGSSLHYYWSIHHQDARLVGRQTRDGLCLLAHFGGDCPVSHVQEFSPWRPGHDQLAIVVGFNRLKVIGVKSLAGIDVDKIMSDTLAACAGVIEIHLEELGAKDQQIMTFQWHPSGEYVSITTGVGMDQAARRVHIVHTKTGGIVHTVPATSRSLGWSPSGDRLLLRLTSDDGEASSYAIWDGNSWAINRDSIGSILTQSWARRLIFEGLCTSDVLSIDGTRLIRRGADGGMYRVVWDKHECQAEAIAELPYFEDVAWHPKDPHCFAALRGNSAEVWELQS